MTVSMLSALACGLRFDQCSSLVMAPELVVSLAIHTLACVVFADFACHSYQHNIFVNVFVSFILPISVSSVHVLVREVSGCTQLCQSVYVCMDGWGVCYHLHSSHQSGCSLNISLSQPEHHQPSPGCVCVCVNALVKCTLQL